MRDQKLQNKSLLLFAGGWLCCFFLLFVFISAWATEQAGKSQFQEACAAYSRGDYQAAIRKFEALTREGMSAPLLYNLANSYAQDGQSGKAILNYERALRLAPGDSDTIGNLELVRKEKGIFQEEHSFGQRFVHLLGLNQWLGVTAFAFLGFAGVLLMPPSIPMKRTSRYTLATAFLLVTVTASFGASGQYKHWNDGVVIAADARLRVSPFESAASIGSIQEGRLLRPGKSHNNFVLVEDESGRSGWLAADAFERIAIP
ncbi:MAG: tetratricopeptide repeat protein [Desulfocapsa sp.]|nr:tetratricopeptide repeat protein [Desulfocapsa sp.]